MEFTGWSVNIDRMAYRLTILYVFHTDVFSFRVSGNVLVIYTVIGVAFPMERQTRWNGGWRHVILFRGLWRPILHYFGGLVVLGG